MTKRQKARRERRALEYADEALNRRRAAYVIPSWAVAFARKAGRPNPRKGDLPELPPLGRLL